MSHEDPEVERISRLWTDLSRELWAPGAGESLAERLHVKPWLSTDPRIRAAWDTLTDPKNLEALVRWAQSGTKNMADEEAAAIALRACRTRLEGR